jgi:hypothetical protein
MSRHRADLVMCRKLPGVCTCFFYDSSNSCHFSYFIVEKLGPWRRKMAEKRAFYVNVFFFFFFCVFSIAE